MERFSIGSLGKGVPSPEASAPETPTPAPQRTMSPVDVISAQIKNLTYKQCLVISDLIQSRKQEARDEAIKQALELMGAEGSVTFEGKQYTLDEEGNVKCS